MVDGVDIGFDIFGPLYGIAVMSHKVWTLERIVCDRITGWKVFAVDWPSEHVTDHIRMDIFLSFSQHSLPAILVYMEMAIGQPSSITMGFDKPVLLDRPAFAAQVAIKPNGPS